jgi:hypothetical protein
MNQIKFALFFLLLILFACRKQSGDHHQIQQDLSDAELIFTSLDALTDVMVDNIFSPPVASRIYAYPLIAAYECARFSDRRYKSYAGYLNGLSQLPVPDTSVHIYYDLAALVAFNEVGRALIFTEAMFMDKIVEQEQKIRGMRIPKANSEASKNFGLEMADAIIAWAKNDNYHPLRSAPKYTVDFDNIRRWSPTPPGYFDAVEPSWNKIRPMTMQSPDQFVPSPPTEFNLSKESVFYKELIQVYETVKNLTDEQREIAGFWDCNPYTMHVTGHVMVATKKISPGGHWINIGIIAARKKNLDILQSTALLSKLSITLFDAFISCWDEKYRSELVRPETVINRSIDDSWRPLLQTPPFPEHTSGHSVASNSAASILTHLLGDNFEFVDDSEIKYGLGIRSFNSFEEAAAEASISRLYGGIHYMPAIEYGVIQGRELGQYVAGHLNEHLLFLEE